MTRLDDIYILGAHYDSANNAGADDNGSGTAAVMEAARVLAEYEFDCTLTFIAFDVEERGLKGSEAYAAAADARNENILGVVNLDMIAWNPPEQRRNEVWVYEEDAAGQIAQDLVDAINLYGRGLTPYLAGVATSTVY